MDSAANIVRFIHHRATNQTHSCYCSCRHEIYTSQGNEPDPQLLLQLQTVRVLPIYTSQGNEPDPQLLLQLQTVRVLLSDLDIEGQRARPTDATAFADSKSHASHEIYTSQGNEPDPQLLLQLQTVRVLLSDLDIEGQRARPTDATAVADSKSLANLYIAGQRARPTDATAVADSKSLASHEIYTSQGNEPDPQMLLQLQTVRVLLSDLDIEGQRARPTDATAFADSKSLASHQIYTSQGNEPDPQLLLQLQTVRVLPSDLYIAGQRTRPTDATAVADSKSLASQYRYIVMESAADIVRFIHCRQRTRPTAATAVAYSKSLARQRARPTAATAVADSKSLASQYRYIVMESAADIVRFIHRRATNQTHRCYCSCRHEIYTSQGNEPDPQLLLQLQTDRQKINELQEENLELRAHSLQQRRRIDELTNRAASLSSQLEESQVAMALLSGRESGAVVTPTPPAPTFIAPTFGYNSPQRIGAGEESLFTSRPQQTTPRADGRKRPVRFAFSHNQNQTSEESSPTDEIIHNARARIQQLEEESAAVQRNYHAFQTRLMSSDSVMFPPLGSSLRTRNTPLRVRTSNVMPFLPFSNVPYPHNSVSYRSTFRPVVDEENEDSSSDQTSLYETGRIENVTNSRRLFTQRNMRQFERWKQFKKKFQRRDTLDQCRRNIRQSQSNTSSEDDEGDLRNARRRQELIKQSKLCTVQQTESHISDATEADNGQELDQIPAQLVSRNSKEENKSEAKVPTAMITEHYEQSSVPAEKVLVSNLESTVEDNLKLYADLEQSVKLIESVKLLLESQNVVNPTSTLSNGSLAVVESLPRDSQSGSQNGIAVSDNSSFPTVQRLFTRSRVEAVDKVNSEGDNVETVRTNQDRVSISEEISKTVINESVTVLPSRDEEQEDDDVQENIPVPLSVPMLRLVSPGLSVANEDFIDTAAVTSSDIVEHESGDRGTTSSTSGSDILRELNPSKTESSDSVVSTGLADVSKLSSDFWD
ncbi:hypothetical protein J6590_089353 [Homalodisca vitripennis]|nr:hypothetical protein J6590_089353 [Homalodisca vitripennis]